MLKSMTGFGRFEASEGDRKVTVEIKSVNHRYLELGIKVPKKLNFLEGDIRNELKKYVERGKVDVFITYENQGEGNECVRYNPTLARECTATQSRSWPAGFSASVISSAKGQ